LLSKALETRSITKERKNNIWKKIQKSSSWAERKSLSILSPNVPGYKFMGKEPFDFNQ
jgi:hypothetical protein